MTKKFSSKFFRVAVEGATTDGRKIERSWLEQAAKNYNPKTYGARIWLEHLRGTIPDSPFKAYGDVTALKAEEIDINGSKKLALFAQITPTDSLVELNKANQKIYTSIEISDKFADTGEAYLVGLGITDSPASIGTDVLSFAAQNQAANPFASRKQHANNLFSEAIETVIEINEVSPSALDQLNAKFKDFLAGFNNKKTDDDSKFGQVSQALNSQLEINQATQDQVKAFNDKQTELETKLAKLSTDFANLQSKLSQQPNSPSRPHSTGGHGQELTDC